MQQDLCELSDPAPEVCQKGDSFPAKEDERHFCLYSGIYPYFNKMQNTSPLMYTNIVI